MDFRRAVLSICLGLILLLIWQEWVDYEQQKDAGFELTEQLDLPSQTPSAPEPASQIAAEVPQAPAAGPAAPADANIVPSTSSALESVSSVEVQTDVLKVSIDTYGGELRVARLLKYPVEVEMPDVPYRLLRNSAVGLLVAQSGLVGNEQELPNHKTTFSSQQSSYALSDSQDSLQVPLYWTSPSGVEYVKLFTFYRDSYLVDVEFRVSNSGSQIWQGYQYGQFLSTEQVIESEGFLFFRTLPSYRGAAIYTPETKYDKIDYDEIKTESPVFETESGWVAMLEHYFVTAWLPQEKSPFRLYTKPLRSGAGPTQYQIGYVALSPTTIQPNSTGVLRSQIYIGPKEQKRIEDPAEGLILTVDYGWLTPVSSPLFWLLQKINLVINNWGWSIILLTLLVKIVFYPLSAASYKSMAKMKKLQPRLKTLKERFGDDKQKMNQAMMEIYKKEKINPLGGCLPILIQIPVFIALYWVLLESVELRQAPFIFWLTDLSRSDPYYVLPVLMGASMFAQQFLNPTPLDALQKNIMMTLPIVFTVFFLWFPSGLVLYWLVNNVLSIAQQWYITRKLIAS